MAIPKVCGIETEYGIFVRGPVSDAVSNPVAASSMLINAYLSANNRKVGWDFEDEHPGMDARGFSVDDLLAPEIETHLVNAVLTNGARYYVDHAHPEISTPECLTAREALVFDRAAEEIVRASMAAAAAILPAGAEILCHKNNSDGKGNSYGCHENYCTSRSDELSHYAEVLIPFLVSRQIFTGAGKVLQTARGPLFSMAQRAEHIWEGVSSATTRSRPIINTRDEPHADAEKYRRLHVIV
ncbi:MAG: proteasome accessory factor PafA2 family protein, partial [Actinomycetia bacterium]|nr:proteasome accessory factor PafA2 family protein [Actinomycetes bacterium]